MLFGCAQAMSGNAALPTFKCSDANDEDTVTLRNYLVRLVTASAGSELDSNRVLYRLPSGAPSIVVHQTRRSLCTQAAQAYHNAVDPGRPQVSRTVVVIMVGTDRYVVLDPAYRYGEFQYHIIFDSVFTKLQAFAG